MEEDIKHVPQFVLLAREKQRHFLETLIFSSEQRLSLKIILDILSEKDDFFSSYSSESGGVDPSDMISVESKSASEAASKITSEDFDKIMVSRFALNQKYIRLLIDEINSDLEKTQRPFRIVDFAGGYQFATLNEYGELVASVVKAKSKKRISTVQLETLAIIAYKQPVTKPEIEQIRGVNSKEAVNSLIDKEFVTVIGRSEKVGKPLLYATTSRFLEAFGLKSLKDLPNLKEINEITNDKPSDADLAKVTINPTTMTEDQSNSVPTDIIDKEDTDLSDQYVLNK